MKNVMFSRICIHRCPRVCLVCVCACILICRCGCRRTGVYMKVLDDHHESAQSENPKSPRLLDQRLVFDGWCHWQCWLVQNWWHRITTCNTFMNHGYFEFTIVNDSQWLFAHSEFVQIVDHSQSTSWHKKASYSCETQEKRSQWETTYPLFSSCCQCLKKTMVVCMPKEKSSSQNKFWMCSYGYI